MFSIIIYYNIILIPVNISWNSVLFIWKVSKRSTLISLLVAACYSTKHVATEINGLQSYIGTGQNLMRSQSLSWK